MATAEVPSPGSLDRPNLFKKLKNALVRLFHQKKIEEIEREAREADAERRRAETRTAWDEEETKRETDDRKRAYWKRQTEEDLARSLEDTRTIRKQQLKEKLDEYITSHGSEATGYLYQELVRDANTVEQLKELIEANPIIGNLMEQLVGGGKDLHGDPATLINLCRTIYYEAGRAPGVNGRAAITPLIEAVKQHLSQLIPDRARIYDAPSREKKGEIGFDEWFAGRVEAEVNRDQLQTLKGDDEARRKAEIENLITSVAVSPEASADWVRESEDRSDTRAATAGIANTPAELVNAVDKIWEDVESSEGKTPLSVQRLQEIDRELLGAESRYFPRDVIPGTKAWERVVFASRDYIEYRRKALAEQLQKRIKLEKPRIKTGISSEKEFFEEMAANPGHLGYILARNPEMKKLLEGYDEKSRKFRDKVFLTIHQQILTDYYHSARDNFGLYETADFDSFTKIIRAGMADLIRPETGIAYGQTWVEWYINLSNTIRLSRDIDYWASQPDATIQDVAKSLALFQNANSVQALTMPAVELAYRAYEDTLQSIRDSNDGYIPPACVGYDAANMISYWDQKSQDMLVKWMKRGVVYDVKRDEAGFHKVDGDANTVLLDPNNKLNYNDLQKDDPQNLKLNMYMTLGKGFGLASLRYLEMFANSKIPGSGLAGFKAEGFHSTPYEGPARSLNWFADMIHKWRYGSYKYLHLMNTLLPEDGKIRHITETTPMEVYKAFRDKAHIQKYGPHVKRLFDLVNFSGVSSAFGPPYTQWRHMDATMGWDDRRKEWLGGPTLIMFSKRFAIERVKDYLVTAKYKKEFRQAMQDIGKPTSGEQFDRLWQSRSMEKYGTEIDKKWSEIKERKEVEEMIEKYRKAFITRVWIQMAMRNPLAVAHNAEVEVQDELFPGKTKKIRLHSFIAQQVLNIPLEDTKYGKVDASVAVDSTPTKEQKHYMEEVMDLEADLAAVREQAVDENGFYREMTEDDFKRIIKDDASCQQAMKYWKMVRQYMMGSHYDNPKEIYERIGLKLGENGLYYDLDWNKIHQIDETLKELGSKEVRLDEAGGITVPVMLNQELVEKDWDLIFGTDDTNYRRMNVLNLGPRQWARRGGDAVAHFQGGTKAGEYMRDLEMNPNPEELAKRLKEVRMAYEGDMIEAGWQVAGLLTHGTMRLFALDYNPLKFVSSVAQREITHTRRNTAAWTANARRKFIDALEHLDVLPPKHTEDYDIQGSFGVYRFPHDLHSLRKQNRADNKDVWTEIVLLGIMLAMAMTIYRAFTAADEEGSGGGGGSHGGGGGHH